MDPKPGLLHDYSSANWHKVLDVDLHGVFYVAKAVLAVMVKQRSGKVINIGKDFNMCTNILTNHDTNSSQYVWPCRIIQCYACPSIQHCKGQFLPLEK